MKRTTIVLDDGLAALLERERRRQGVSASAIIRTALDAYFVQHRHSAVHAIFNLGATGRGEAVGRNAEEILAAEYADLIQRESGLTPWHPNTDLTEGDEASIQGSDIGA